MQRSMTSPNSSPDDVKTVWPGATVYGRELEPPSGRPRPGPSRARRPGPNGPCRPKPRWSGPECRTERRTTASREDGARVPRRPRAIPADRFAAAGGSFEGFSAARSVRQYTKSAKRSGDSVDAGRLASCGIGRGRQRANLHCAAVVRAHSAFTIRHPERHPRDEHVRPGARCDPMDVTPVARSRPSLSTSVVRSSRTTSRDPRSIPTATRRAVTRCTSPRMLVPSRLVGWLDVDVVVESTTITTTFPSGARKCASTSVPTASGAVGTLPGASDRQR
jgi:hypothetical protein